MNKEQLLQLLNEIAHCLEENKLFLTKLDTEIGDGDHGINMARGFHAVAARLSDMT
ncbi:MAG TPA: dihydroxyacetone kinase, partial [Ruminococcaceae bacterium]|nr:dihydroxyacetone kinase [Oscillospiraceae bacterium]